MILRIHVALGIIALCAGAWNLVARKGTSRHRGLGWVYVGSMAGLIGTSFGIYEVFDSVGPFHVMSLVSGATLLRAIYAPLRRNQWDDWLEYHYMWISWSYVGLVMATGSHLFEYGPSGWSFWARAGLCWGLPYGIGAALIFGWRNTMVRRFSTGAKEGDTP